VTLNTHRWWRDAVIYQVYVRSFLDSTGDGIGDLAGVRAGMPYLKKLGVDGIWLSPFYPSPQHDHGYDVADYCDVDPLFGDLAEFDLLMTRSPRSRAARPVPASTSPTDAARRAPSRPTTGTPCSADPPGPASPRRTATPASGTCTCSRPSSPT
jgi:hypothetical protein